MPLRVYIPQGYASQGVLSSWVYLGVCYPLGVPRVCILQVYTSGCIPQVYTSGCGYTHLGVSRSVGYSHLGVPRGVY